jgi:tripartite-type tricarboxylate transporter receptor subunit TctC
VAPAGTPKPIINRLHTEIVKALRSPEITGRLVAEGSEIGGISPDEFGRYIRTEITKWKKVVVDAKIQLE